MAYNPAMYYGNMYGNSYGQGYPAGMNSMGQPGQISYAAPQQQDQEQMGIVWVDGEVGAKARQLPPGWQANKPFPLWDSNDTIIYLKSFNQMGMPNPLQKIHYTMEEQTPRHVGAEVARLESGDSRTESMPDMSGYVRKEDLDNMKNELKRTIMEMQNQTSNTQDTRGARANGKSSV